MPSTTRLLFGLLILMALTIMALATLPQNKGETGSSHPETPPGTLLQAPSGTTRSAGLLWGGGLFGMFVAAFAVVAMELGLVSRPDLARGRYVLRTLAVLYALSLACVVALYQATLLENPRTYLLGFPISTAAMLFLFGILIPTFPIVVYLVMFSRWILTPEDIERFEDLVAARRDREAQ